MNTDISTLFPVYVLVELTSMIFVPLFSMGDVITSEIQNINNILLTNFLITNLYIYNIVNRIRGLLWCISTQLVQDFQLHNYHTLLQ